MKYKHFLLLFKAFFAAISCFQNVSSVHQTDQVRVNVTRQNDGDVLVFEDKVDCASLNAKCSPASNNERETTKYNICDRCKCLSTYTTYLSTDRENQCINTNQMTNLNNCRIFRQRQTAVLEESTKAISRPIQAYICEIKERHPEFYSDNTDTWIQMLDISFVLESHTRGNRRLRNWLVTFKNNAISKMMSKYAGGIAKLKVSCKKRRALKYYNLCIIFKIAGSVTLTGGNSTLVNSHNPYHPSSTSMKTPSGNNTAQNEKSKSGKNNQTVWIIVTVLIVIIIVLIGVIFFICFKRRQIKSSNGEYRRRDIMLHDYDAPSTKSSFQDGHVGNPQAADHIYATVSDMQNASSPTHSTPNHYQELNLSDREKDVSHYQPLVQPELQYVDILPDQTEAEMPITGDN